VELGLILPYEGSLSFVEALELTHRAEALGFDSVWMPEAYGTDAISILGALAARTERIRLGTGIVNVFSRTPALLAQTAATLDLISGGRFILGLGTSGHQVISGWHGVPFERPVLRMRETIAIVRQVLRRERLEFRGEVFQLDKGLKLLARPVRATVPIFLATLTPAGLRLTGELADGWMPTLFSPEHMDVFRAELETGARAGGRSLSSLAIAPHVPVVIDDDRARARDAVRVVPDALVDAITIAGPAGYAREQLAAWSAAGVTLLVAAVQGKTQDDRLRTVEILAAATAGVH